MSPENAELGFHLFDPLRPENAWAENQGAIDAAPNHEFAEYQAGADRLSQPHVIGYQRYGQAAAERHQILHLMMVGRNPVLPVDTRLNILGTFDNDRIGEAPIQSRPKEEKLFLPHS